MVGVGRGRQRMRATSVVLIGTLIAAGLGTATPVLAVSTPVAHWKLDDAAGTNVNDEIGTADGTTSGSPAWLTSNAAIGTGALRFDGTNDKVTVPSSSAIEPAELLLTVWVRGDPQDPPAAGQVILEKGAFGCNGPSYGLYVRDGGIRFSYRAINGQQVVGQDYPYAAVDLWDGAWHLIALKLAFANNNPEFVVGNVRMDGYPASDGFISDSFPDTETSAIKYAGATHNELVMGAPVDSGCGGTSFDGDLDDVRLYSDPLFEAGTLMPTVNVDFSGFGVATAHPSGPVTTSVDVSPIPRWGSVYWQYYEGNAWEVCCAANPTGAEAHLEPIPGGGVGPATVGTYPFRAWFTASAPYADTIETSTLEVTPWPTTTTVLQPDGPTQPYTNVFLAARVSSTAIPSSAIPVGSVKFYDETPNPRVFLGTGLLGGATGPGESGAGITTNLLGGGSHAIVAEFIGPDPVRANSTSEPLDVVIGKVTPYVAIAGPPDTVDVNMQFTVEALVNSTTGTYAQDATVTIKKVGSATPICTLPVAGFTTPCEIAGQPIGSPQYYVEYSGNADTAAKTSDPITVQIVADFLRATNVGTSSATVYPVKDNYRDSVAIRGTRNEPIAVTIKIFKPTGALLATKTFGSAAGGYAYAWNGRTTTGAILPEGKYKVVQTLKDGGNNTITVTSYVTLSKKKLVYSTKTLTQTGSSLDAKGYLGTGTVKVGSGSVTLHANSDGSSWAGAGWEFSLPSATVYKSIVAQLYGRRAGGPGVNYLAGQRFDRCAYKATGDWKTYCFQSLITIPVSSSNKWYKSAALASAFTSGRHLRLSANTTGGTLYVYKVSIVVTYGVLTY